MRALHEAARALVAIDAAGALQELRDELMFVRREWRRDQDRRTIGEPLRIDGLAKLLQADGIDPAGAWTAVADAIRPSWASVLLTAIIEFAARLSEGRSE